MLLHLYDLSHIPVLPCEDLQKHEESIAVIDPVEKNSHEKSAQSISSKAKLFIEESRF